MLSAKQKKLIDLCARIAFVVPLAVGLIASIVVPDSALVGWAISVGVLLGGVYMCVLALQAFTNPAFMERLRVNSWVRAARLVFLLFAELCGALCIGFGGIVIVGLVLGRLPSTLTVLNSAIIFGFLLVLMLGMGALGLLGVGYIAQGNEETRQWSRTFGQRGHAAPTGPAEDERPPA